MVKSYFSVKHSSNVHENYSMSYTFRSELMLSILLIVPTVNSILLRCTVVVFISYQGIPFLSMLQQQSKQCFLVESKTERSLLIFKCSCL